MPTLQGALMETMMGRRFGPDGGTVRPGPMRAKDRLASQTQAYEGLSRGWNPRQYCDLFFDFAEEQSFYDVFVPLVADNTNVDANYIDTTNTKLSRGTVEIPRAGRLVSAQFSGEDALAAHDTNYLTFAVTNKLASGSGAIAMLAATDANTTKATGGTAVAAIVGRSLTVHGTAANLNVAAGDVVLVTATTAGTLANAIDNPIVRLRFATVPPGLTPLVARTAGSPLVAPVDDTLNGEITCKLAAANEVNTAGVSFGDQLVIPANQQFLFEARVKVSGCTTAEAVLIGMGTAYNATWDNVTANAWFRLAASLALLAETDDATTDSDDQSCSKTLVADTYYVFRIDATDKGRVEFWVDDELLLTLSASAWAVTHLMQPIIAISKASGTTVPALTCDYVRLIWGRF